MKVLIFVCLLALAFDDSYQRAVTDQSLLTLLEGVVNPGLFGTALGDIDPEIEELADYVEKEAGRPIRDAMMELAQRLRSAVIRGIDAETNKMYAEFLQKVKSLSKEKQKIVQDALKVILRKYHVISYLAADMFELAYRKRPVDAESSMQAHEANDSEIEEIANYVEKEVGRPIRDAMMELAQRMRLVNIRGVDPETEKMVEDFRQKVDTLSLEKNKLVSNAYEEILRKYGVNSFTMNQFAQVFLANAVKGGSF